MKLDINWTDDCQGKKDYDGDIVSVSTRYWPGYMTVFDTAKPENGLHEISVGNPSAHCTIMLSDGYPYHNGKTQNLIDKDFKGKTFEDVADQVEAWSQAQMDRISSVLRKEFFGWAVLGDADAVDDDADIPTHSLESEINAAEPAYNETVRLEVADLVSRGVATPDEIAQWVESRMSYAWLEGASFPVIENAYRGRLHLLVHRRDRLYSWLFVARDLMAADQQARADSPDAANDDGEGVNHV